MLFPLDAVKKSISTCTSVEKVNEVHYVVRLAGKRSVNYLLRHRLRTISIGYAGNVPLFLAVSGEDVILGLTLLDNASRPGF